MITVTVWLGFIGFLDDYIKVFKKNKKGLAGKFKVVGQIGVGIIVGSVLYFNSNVVIKEKVKLEDPTANYEIATSEDIPCDDEGYVWRETKSLKTTIPFVKNNEFDY